MSITDEYATNQNTKTVFDFIADRFPDSEPYVRYGFPREGGGQKQEYRLRSIHDDVPEGAITASAIYLVTNEQLARLNRFAVKPYAISGDGNIVLEIQTECERAGRVLYPVYLESDARDDGVPFPTMADWIQNAISDKLGLSPTLATFWYSGSRSVHGHAPKFVTHSNLPILKTRFDQFCEETGAELDLSVYKSKQQFRLPGAVHQKSGGAFQKVPIDPSWENDQIIRAAGRGIPHPETFADVLTETFTSTENADDFLLTLEAAEKVIDTPLIEQVRYPENPTDAVRWLQYNDKEFSPYALASGNGRSVAVVEIKGTPFCRKKVRNGAPLIPTYFYGARGCAGGEFIKEEKHAPLQLSARDYGKWDYEIGDHVVIIGGQSRNSRIFRVDSLQATIAGNALTGEGASLQAALDYLQSEGYDVGKAGTSGRAAPSKTAGTRGGGGRTSSRYASTIPPVRNPTTTAAQLQQRAEQDGIGTLSHIERGRVACRVLGWGWEPAWEWFKRQYGAKFKPEVTRTQFRSVIQTYPDDYDHVEIPEKQA